MNQSLDVAFWSRGAAPTIEDGRHHVVEKIAKTKCGGANMGEKWGLFLARRSYQTKAPLVRGVPEGDQPTVAVVIGAELRQPQCPTVGELL